MCEELCYAILTVSGPDKVGVGAAASCFILDNHGNILQEDGKVFCPEYAHESLIFEAKREDMENIKRTYTTILHGLQPVFIEIKKPVEDGYQPHRYVLEVVAADCIGITSTIESELAERGINVLEVEGRRKLLAGTDQALYAGSFHITVPPESLSATRELVNQFVRDQHWDIDLRPDKCWHGTQNMIPLFRKTMSLLTAVAPPSRRFEFRQ